mmetsp:Transcript_20877/g.53320  ORF Transcript_20877/g.53320 Transcript_20877/m.53320 type:complete len:342 (+) Transcript_20877:75-1100(+)
MLLQCAELLAYERQGYLVHRGLLSATRLANLMPEVNQAWSAQQLDAHRQKLRVIIGEEELLEIDNLSASPEVRLAALKGHLAQMPEGAIPFMQGFNLWRSCEVVRELASSPALAGTASQLLGARRVRLYQDSLFVKRPGDGPTHWHSDLAMSPLDTNAFVTVWLPCQPVPAEKDGGSGLVFASGSHRDVGLHFWHSGGTSKPADASLRGYEEYSPGALALGDATWHHGWTLHTASANPLPSARVALAFSFFADGATRLPRRSARQPHNEDAESYAAWTVGDGAVLPGRQARHPLLPLVWADGKPKAITSPKRVNAGASVGAKTLASQPKKQRSRANLGKKS